MQPFFTIVVPTYNRANLIVKTLESLFAQSFADFEILIIDDGSTDNTEKVVQPFLSEKVFYHKKQNAERAAARNFGANLAKGKYVNFFDSDDLALTNHLAEAAKLLTHQPDAEWFHLGYEWADADGKVFKQVNNFTGATLNSIIAHGNPLSCNGVFIRKDIIKANPFNEDRALSASEDYELWCRLAARHPLFYTNTITSVVIDHDSRSVRTIHGEQLITRLNLLISYLQKDKVTTDYFGNNFSKIKMDANSYIALHLVNEPKYKIKGILYLLKALKDDTHLLKTKRFYATIKNIITKW